jgi:23S rRNA (adenine2503-C2)-methyltransferase
MGLKRNLTGDEIVDQVRFWRRQPNTNITNIVFMGMGEPLANYDTVKAALTTLIDHCGIGKTRIVLSTVAFPIGLKRLITDADFPDVRLAISLHAGSDATRAKIVPSHRRHSIATIVAAIEQYLAARHNRRHHVTLEYVMLLNVNDQASEAEALVRTFKHLRDQVRFNLIPWNQTAAALQRSSEEHMQAFQAVLQRGGLHSTVRYSKGLDITAACGQLAVQANQSALAVASPASL